uniref:Uncharacterized protein n=1 Tax=Ananas comosus var. bracteatus TaxID=296719 RepID=A0A6V7PGQ5_ANACO|nr:unnamed protein product [Ananas comosus var. bracteatus]
MPFTLVDLLLLVFVFLFFFFFFFTPSFPLLHPKTLASSSSSSSLSSSPPPPHPWRRATTAPSPSPSSSGPSSTRPIAASPASAIAPPTTAIGGWHQLEETINFLLLKLEEGKLLNPCLLRDIFKDLIGSLTEISSEENVFMTQPCRDNALYILKLIDELLINESSDNLLFPDIGLSSGFSFDGPQRDSPNDVRSAIAEILDS